MLVNKKILMIAIISANFLCASDTESLIDIVKEQPAHNANNTNTEITFGSLSTGTHPGDDSEKPSTKHPQTINESSEEIPLITGESGILPASALSVNTLNTNAPTRPNSTAPALLTINKFKDESSDDYSDTKEPTPM